MSHIRVIDEGSVCDDVGDLEEDHSLVGEGQEEASGRLGRGRGGRGRGRGGRGRGRRKERGLGGEEEEEEIELLK